jgi:putative transposase
VKKISKQFRHLNASSFLVVVDDGTRECLALVPDTSISGIRVARERCLRDLRR